MARKYELSYLDYISQENWPTAFHIFDQYINGKKKKKNYFLFLFFIFFIFYFFYFLLFLFFILGDFWTYGTFVQNITGLNDYFNILSPKYPPNPFQQYLNRNDVRNATHGKNLFFILLFYFIFLNNIFIF